MASFEDVGSVVDSYNSQELALEYHEILNFPDENTPLSPGEVQIMRNQPKITSKLFSPSRKSAKAKSFTVHGSPCASTLSKSAHMLGPDSLEKRKTLQVLQPSANGNGVLVGSTVVRKEKLKEKKKCSKSKQRKASIQTSEEGSSPGCTDSSDSDTHCRTSNKAEDIKEAVSDEAFALMVQDPPPERYWQMLAEERRLALKDSLEENKKLCKQLQEMKERCSKLEEVASQAEYFANLYSMVMEGEAPDLESSENSESDNQPITCTRNEESTETSDYEDHWLEL